MKITATHDRDRFLIEHRNSRGAFASQVCYTLEDAEEWVTRRTYRGDQVRVRFVPAGSLEATIMRATWKPIPRLGYTHSVVILPRD